MLLINETHPVEVNATLRELYLLSLWVKNPRHTASASGTKLIVTSNGSDCVDYYGCLIQFSDDFCINDTKLFLEWVRSLDQESNFGGIRDNEFWITEKDVKVED